MARTWSALSMVLRLAMSGSGMRSISVRSAMRAIVRLSPVAMYSAVPSVDMTAGGGFSTVPVGAQSMLTSASST